MMRALGEMFYSDPSQHTFVSFINKYLGPTVGHFSGWTYWLGLVFVCMAELTAVATYVQYWFPNLPAWIIEITFLAILASVNLIAARLFGEAEFWFSMIKILAILALIATGIFMMVKHTATPVGHASVSNLLAGFTMFPHGITSFVNAIPMVFFAFMGIEFVTITIGEAKTPHVIIKKAVNETLLRILFFYIGALAVIMGIIPWTSLNANSSPFVQVFKIAGVPAAAAFINFVVLTSAASSLNSNLFSAGRHFYQLATETPKDSRMYKFFAKISSNRVPATAIIFTAAIVLVTPLMSLTKSVSTLFTTIAGCSSDMFIIVYVLAMFAHRKYRQSKDFLPNGFKMPLYKISSPLVIAFFGFVYLNLFLIPGDTIGAVGSLLWAVIFGGVTYLHERKVVAQPVNQQQQQQ